MGILTPQNLRWRSQLGIKSQFCVQHQCVIWTHISCYGHRLLLCVQHQCVIWTHISSYGHRLLFCVQHQCVIWTHISSYGHRLLKSGLSLCHLQVMRTLWRVCWLSMVILSRCMKTVTRHSCHSNQTFIHAVQVHQPWPKLVNAVKIDWGIQQH